MSFIDFKAIVKKVNMRPKGLTEITLAVNSADLDGKIQHLSEMIDQKVESQLESTLVNYNVEINPNTNKPTTSYKVDQHGVVSEVEPQPEQLEAELGLPKENIPTKKGKRQIERAIIEEFITSGMAPNFEEFPSDFPNFVKRKIEGESYSKLASELDISSGKIVDLMDQYFAKVAPLADTWWAWKQDQDAEAEPLFKQENDAPAEEDVSAENHSQDDQEDEEHGAA
ncbi:hypothetical protein MOF28_19865 [Bacillus haynesii]|uniref:hypothetical protein n=1 Tax=Bacillus haynesii TaxID=1925021 RepID=UPI0022828671|nr:hypothetical protein [Bacillus haynesii]MCY9340587.1 hypothetical protein [Bacillus haynesii]